MQWRRQSDSPHSRNDPLIDITRGAGLAGLAISAFLSATLLPGNVEAVLLAVLSQHAHLFWTVIAVATVTNTAGGMTSYALGRFVPKRVEQGGRDSSPPDRRAAIAIGASVFSL
jgi:membrane protein YqaA with SNARE-associated domain